MFLCIRLKSWLGQKKANEINCCSITPTSPGRAVDLIADFFFSTFCPSVHLLQANRETRASELFEFHAAKLSPHNAGTGISRFKISLIHAGFRRSVFTKPLQPEQRFSQPSCISDNCFTLPLQRNYRTHFFRSFSLVMIKFSTVGMGYSSDICVCLIQQPQHPFPSRQFL